MRKIISIISAFAISAMMTACSAENDTAEATETTVSTSSAETEAATEAETTANAQTEAEDGAPKAEDETVESIDEIFANKGDVLWMEELADKVNSCENNVKITMHELTFTPPVTLSIELLGDKYIHELSVGEGTSKQVFDGTTCYLIDDAKKQYCIRPDTMEKIYTYMLSDEELATFTDTGISEIQGKKYIYEEYNESGIPTRFYFDENKNPAYYAFAMEDGQKAFSIFNVEITDKTDDSIFAVPADYTEITYDEYTSSFQNN